MSSSVKGAEPARASRHCLEMKWDNTWGASFLYCYVKSKGCPGYKAKFCSIELRESGVARNGMKNPPKYEVEGLLGSGPDQCPSGGLAGCEYLFTLDFVCLLPSASVLCYFSKQFSSGPKLACHVKPSKSLPSAGPSTWTVLRSLTYSPKRLSKEFFQSCTVHFPMVRHSKNYFYIPSASFLAIPPHPSWHLAKPCHESSISIS